MQIRHTEASGRLSVTHIVLWSEAEFILPGRLKCVVCGAEVVVDGQDSAEEQPQTPGEGPPAP